MNVLGNISRTEDSLLTHLKNDSHRLQILLFTINSMTKVVSLRMKRSQCRWTPITNFDHPDKQRSWRMDPLDRLAHRDYKEPRSTKPT